jgi:sporulation protein YlmC with PRC-barrel domain
MASNLIGAKVKNVQDENIGDIKDIVFSNQGQPTHVIIDIGDRDVEVEKSKLEISASEDGVKVVLNGTQADLAQLPAVNVGAPEQQTDATTSQPAQQTSTEPATTGEQAATEQPAQQTATAEQPEQKSTTTEQPAQQTATTEQPAQQSATTEQQPQQTTAEQPASTEAPAETTASVEQPSTGEASQAQPAEQALAIPEGLMVSDLMGATIYSPSDEKLGEINDLTLSPGAGQPPQVIIGVGGFFGIGEKDVPVDMSRLKFTTTEDGLKIVLDATKQDLENLAANSSQ